MMLAAFEGVPTWLIWVVFGMPVVVFIGSALVVRDRKQRERDRSESEQAQD